MINSPIRSALITILKSKRKKMNRAQRHRGLKPTRWLYPWTTEKHYAAAIRAWMRPMRDYVNTYLKEHSEAILHGDSSTDVLRLDATTGKSFKTMVNSLDAWVAQYISDDPARREESPVYTGLGNIAETAYNFNEGQYEKSAKAALGIEFPVGEDWWPDARETWQDRNYKLIQSDIRKYISQIDDMTERAVTSGSSLGDLSKQIMSLNSKLTQGRAAFIARDQIGKLNGQITQRRQESAGLSMYIWSTSGDEKVRGDPGGFYPNADPSHFLMDGLLCRWDDPTVYSDDGGKTWRDRPSGAVRLHPGDDYQCRCTALAYWNEIVDEVDDQIDLLSESEDNIPQTDYEGLNVMNPPGARSNNQSVQQQQEAKEYRRREQNAKKAQKAASQLFPGENWKKVEDGIYLSPRRPIGKKTNFQDEKRDAQILRDLGSTVYLTPEDRTIRGRKYDAIVNGQQFEFKNVGGNANTLITHFLKSRSQAPNVFINLENSNLTRREIISTLYGARNSVTHTDKKGTIIKGYADSNTFSGGKIILKIKDQGNLVYLNVDDLKIKRH